MYILKFKDNDKNIISSLNEVYEELRVITNNIHPHYVGESNYSLEFYHSFLTGENERIHILTGEILKNIKDEDGIYIILLSCPLYIAHRIVEHSSMALEVFKNVKITRELRPYERNILKCLQSEISFCNYILKYSKQVSRKINSIYGHTDTDLIGGVFDDYPEYIGGFMPSPTIPCDGEDREKSSK
ncbi:MAG: hypothetical protein IJH65_13315 [Methanobrevibacter sp.]|nr:hypothetical protein [Methanobrevibacter sp.]